MYTLKGISFVANASLFDISIIFFCCFLRVFFCAEKTFFRSIDFEFFFVCVLCVFWMDFLSIFGTGIYREEGKLCSTRKCRHAMGCHYLFHKSV